MKMKTTLYDFQESALERLDGQPCFALFMEQGTGKTICALAHAPSAL